MENKLFTIKLETKMPRKRLPPPTKKFIDRKKEANKRACRQWNKRGK